MEKGQNMEIEDLIIINKINPIERFNFINRKELRELSVDILLSLYTIDKVIRDNTNIDYFYYVQDDKSVYYLLNNSLYENLDHDMFEEALFYLDYAKLIYRFTCAKKFNLEDSIINQLRINSWGREFILQDNILDVNQNRYEKMYYVFNLYFIQYVDLYKELLDALLKPISMHNSQRIKDINRRIEIQLLS